VEMHIRPADRQADGRLAERLTSNNLNRRFP
jgi:hypothetical protein